MKTGMKKKCAILISLLLVLPCLNGCGSTKQEAQTEIPLIEAATDNPQLIEVNYGNVYDMKTYEGEINPYMQMLQFPEDGSFEEYQVMVGDTVKKGQIIATTENKYEDKLKEKKKTIAELETEYNDTVTNYTLQIQTNDWKVGQRREWIENMDSEMDGFNDICIDFELLIAKGEKIKVEKRQYMESAEKELEYQRQCLADMEGKMDNNVVTAPCDGVITYLADLKIGDAVNARSYPAAIADLNQYYVQCEYITPQEASEKKRIYAMKDGKEYNLTYQGYDEHELQEKSAKGEGIYSFFTIDAPDAAISFGDTATVVTINEERDNVLTIPTLCLKRNGEECFVYKDVDGVKKAVNVTIGLSDKINTEIIEGLSKGDYVYASN